MFSIGHLRLDIIKKVQKNFWVVGEITLVEMIGEYHAPGSLEVG